MLRHTRASLASLATLFLLVPTALSQIIPSTLPACVQQCTVIVQAQASCETNADSATTCFCQSTLITGLKSSAANICAPECSTADYTTISNWFNQLCANGGVNTPTTLSTSATPAAGAATPAATTSAAPANSDQTQTQINQNQTGQQWWNSHWQWIVMLIVLLVAFTAIGFGGRWLYRRHQRKKDGVETASGATSSRAPDMGMWAPSRQSVHDFGPSEGAPGPSRVRAGPSMSGAAGPGSSPLRHSNSKGKGREGERPQGPLRAGSRRLRKAANAIQM